MTLKIFSAMPTHMINIMASLTEIPPLSTDTASHKTGVNRQTTDGQPHR